MFRHAEGKESTAVISAMLPSADYHDIDLYLNIAIPDFNSCTARFQAIQRSREQRKQYQYDVSTMISVEVTENQIFSLKIIYFLNHHLTDIFFN